MENYNSSRGLIQQMLRTRMAFRQALQRVLKRNNKISPLKCYKY